MLIEKGDDWEEVLSHKDFGEEALKTLEEAVRLVTLKEEEERKRKRKFEGRVAKLRNQNSKRKKK